MEGNEKKCQKLFEFCASGDRVGLADYIISSGCNPSAYDTRDSVGKTALHIACRHGHFHTVRALILVFGCSPDMTDNKGNLPLHDAFAYGHLDVVNYVLQVTCKHEKFADAVLYTDLEGNSMLHKACQSGNVSVVRYVTSLISRGIILYKSNLYLDSVAIYVVNEVSFESPFKMEEAFSTVNGVGDTPLHVACRHGHLNIIKAYIGVVLTCDLLPSLRAIACQCGFSHIVSYLTGFQDSELGKHSQVDFYSEGIYTAKDSDVCCIHDKPVGKCVDECCHFSSNEARLLSIPELHLALRKKGITLLFACHRCQASLGYPSECLPTIFQCLNCMESFNTQDFSILFCGFCKTVFRPRQGKCFPCRYCTHDSYRLIVTFQPKKKLTQRQAYFTISSNETALQSAARCGNSELVKTLLCSKCFKADSYKDLLVYACTSNETSLMELLIKEYKCDVNNTNCAGNSPLHIACIWGSTEAAKYLLSHDDCDIAIQNESQFTPLHFACCFNRPELCRMLIEKNCMIDIKTKITEETPLHLACIHKSVDLLKNLTSHPDLASIINSSDYYGDSPLFNACRCGEVGIVKLLVEKGADPLFINKRTKETPVHIACRMERLDILQVLLDGYSGQLSQKNLLGATPMHLAVEKRSAPIIKFLVESNYCQADEVLNDSQSTLLHLACYRVQAVVETLVKRLTHYDAQDAKGNTALHIACSLGNPEVVKLLAPYCSILIQNNDKKTPIHISCDLEDAESVQHLLSEFSGSLDNCTDRHGNTALHVACMKHSLDIIKMSLNHCSVSSVNDNQETPVHMACRTGNKPIVDCLLRDLSGSLDSFVNIDEDTFLHIAVKSDSIEVVKSLLDHCSVTKQNKIGFTPIHISCQKKDLTMTKLLAEKCFTLVASKEEGYTFLHIACLGGSLQVVRFLLEESDMDHLKLLQCSTDGSTSLHCACAEGHTDIVLYLVSGGYCSIYEFDNLGQTPLYLAIVLEHTDLVKKVITEGLFKFENNCKKGYPFLHCLVQHLTEKNFELLKSVVANGSCGLNQRDINGNTILHFIVQCITKSDHDVSEDDSLTVYHSCRKIHQLFHKIWTLLLSIMDKDNLRQQNTSRESSLHLLCRLFARVSCHYSSRIDTQFLLNLTEELLKKEHLLASQASQDMDGKTPIQIVVDCRQMVGLLVSYGANPNDVYQMYSSIIDRYKEENPLHPTSTIVVLGHSKAGKSTLIKAFSTDDETVTEIADVDGPTRGVSFSFYHSVEVGPVKFREFAGQPEYESANSMSLENALCTASLEQPLLFFVIVDASKTSLLCKDFQYWINYIENHCPPNLETLLHLVALGSHVDAVRFTEQTTIQKDMQKAMNRIDTKRFKVFGPVLLDCRKPGTEEIKRLKRVLKQSYSSLRNCVEIDCRCHALIALLMESRFRGINAVKFGELQSIIKRKGSISVIILPFQADALLNLVDKLSSGGHVVLLKGSSQNVEDYWIIINQSALFNQLNGALFAPESFGRHPSLQTNTGVVSSQMLESLCLYNLDINLVTEFLIFAELCQRIDDKETLRLITNEVLEPLPSTAADMVSESRATPQSKLVAPTQQYYFFPGLVKSDRPGSTWDTQGCIEYTYSYGWYLQCKQNHFFDARFLQRLLLRLTFIFAAASNTGEHCTDTSLERKCDIWKNGIHWSTRTGVDVIVEVVEQTYVVMLLRCSTGQELEAVKYRCAVMKKILEAKQQVCPTSQTDEFFFHPVTLKSSVYPNVTTVQTKIPIDEIVKAISKQEPCVIDSTNKTLHLKTLLRFDPYMLLGRDNIQVLQSSKDSDKEVSSDFLFSLSKSLLSFFNELVEILEVPSTEVDSLRETWGNTPTAFLHHVFEAWKVYKGNQATYQGLREKFDEYSIFCGRNPLCADSGSLQSLNSDHSTQMDHDPTLSSLARSSLDTSTSSRDHDASLFDHELLKVAVGDLPQHRQAKREMTSDVNFQPTPPKRPRTGIFQPEGTV